MKTSKRICRLAVAAFMVAAIANVADAQSPSGQATIAYRLSQAKTIHFDDMDLAEKHRQVVEKLGCEIAQENHDEHVDVQYRCPEWRSLTVASDRLAHQFETWLKNSGFETLHGHPAGDHDHAHDHAGKQEELSYRTVRTQSRAYSDSASAQSMIAVLRGLGCEVGERENGGRYEIAYSCPEEMLIAFSSHDAAHAWEEWLRSIGFETGHHH